MSLRCRLAGWVLALLLTVSPAVAAELRIGLAAAPTSLDPHFHNNGVNNAQARHIFESLTAQDANQQLKPGLAQSWRLVDDTTWEFQLRRNVTFHDGSPFTADDVAFSLARAPNVPNSPSSSVPSPSRSRVRRSSTRTRSGSTPTGPHRCWPST